MNLWDCKNNEIDRNYVVTMRLERKLWPLDDPRVGLVTGNRVMGLNFVFWG